MISPYLDKYRYESVDMAANNMSSGCFMAKVDIKSAYRGVAIHPSSVTATGMSWILNGRVTTFVDTRLPFGARPSPTIFHRISQFVKRIMQRNGFQKITAYQDDFLVIADNYDECLEAWTFLINLLLRLGFDINYDKRILQLRRSFFLEYIWTVLKCSSPCLRINWTAYGTFLACF